MKNTSAKKFCKCIKSVRKTLKAREGSTKEQGAIAVCVKSMLHSKKLTIKKFKCGPKQRLVTQKKRGGAGVFGWASVNGTLGEMATAIGKRPEKKEDYVQEAIRRIRSADVPPVSPDKEHYYQQALERASPYPELKEMLETMHEGSPWVRRAPLIMLREYYKRESRK